MQYSLLKNSSPNSPVTHRSRRGFLLAEVVAGAALAILALGLTLSILKRDNDLRQRNRSREALLVQSENLLEHIACLPYEQLTSEKLQPLVDVAKKSTRNAAVVLKLELTEQSAPTSHKRVHITAGIEPNSGLVHLWRDYYEQGVAK